MKKLSFFNKIMYVVNSIFSVGLVMSFFFSKIPPNQFIYASIASLIVPLLILGNIFFVLYWILAGFKKQMIQPFLVLLLSYFFLPTLYKIKGNNIEASKNTVKIFSYNVRKFDIYNWLGDSEVGAKINALIVKENPDIVVLQEFKENENFNLKYPYNYLQINQSKKNQFLSGLNLYSKYPIINNGTVFFNRHYSNVIYVDIVKKIDTFRIYNMHLESLGLVPNKDYFGYQDSEKLIQRLSKAFKNQQNEIDSLIIQIKQSPYRAILVGDMNNTAYSWAYKTLRADFKDTFLEAGQGFGKTYEFKKFPLRIDYIFTDKSIKVLNHKTYKNRYSDHYPISAILEF